MVTVHSQRLRVLATLHLSPKSIGVAGIDTTEGIWNVLIVTNLHAVV